MKNDNSKIYRLDIQSLTDLLEFKNQVNQKVDSIILEIAKSGVYEGGLKELQDSIVQLYKKCSEEKPYINKGYNPRYGDNRICKCGHSYIRHFDTFEDFKPCGCKYCECYKFEEITDKDLLERASDSIKFLIGIAKEKKSSQ